MIFVYILTIFSSFLILREANRMYNIRNAHKIVPIYLAIFVSAIPFFLNVLVSVIILLGVYSGMPGNNIQKFRNWFEGP